MMCYDSIDEEMIYRKLTEGNNSQIEGDTVNEFSEKQITTGTEQNPTNNETVKGYLSEILQKLGTMEKNRVNYPEYMMPKQPVYRPVKTARYIAKKGIRKSIDWSLGTVFDRQTTYNSAAVPIIGRLAELQSMAFDSINSNYNTVLQQRKKLEMLKSKTDETEREVSLQNEQITKLETWTKEEQDKQTVRLGIQSDRMAALEEKSQILEQWTKEEQDKQTARLDMQSDRMAALEEKSQILEQWIIKSEKTMKLISESLKIMEEQGVIGQITKIGEQEDNHGYIKKSVSQSGEDTILSYILHYLGISDQKCTYLDLGANHAKQFSNTYYFYDKGARGVLVEANPALIPELKLYRNEDVILNCCISEKKGDPVDFYVLNGDGLSTPDKGRVDEVIALNPSLKIDRIVTVKTMTVNEIMEEYFEKAPVFLNIDLEGDDMAILRSIDWGKYRPLMVSIEMIPYKPHLVVGEKDEQILKFMAEKEYIEYAFTGINSIFIDKRQIKDVLS